MPENFNLTMRIGNDAMQTPADIALALREIAASIGDSDIPVSELGPYESVIHDVNGNDVGTWEVA
jgi:hypothetical protein